MSRSDSPVYSIFRGNDQLEALHIGISGLIGVGKTTLCTALGKVLNLPTYYEGVIDNAYLEDFYKDPKKYSFPLQIYLLNQRFQQQQLIIWQGKGGVQDRTIYEDSVFAKMLMESGNMEKRDYETYCSMFRNLSNFMRIPNLIVHLDVSPQESLNRIRLRNRDCEKGITLDYLVALDRAYQEFLQDISKYIAVIRVNWGEYKDAEELAAEIKKEYLKMRNIHMRKTVIHNGEVKQIDVKNIYEREKDMDDTDVEFHYFFTKDNIKIKFFIWLFFQYLAVKIEFGAVFFVISVAVYMFRNLGKKQKNIRKMSRKLTKQEEERITHAINKMQMKEVINTTFQITNHCFEACINNFRLRKLDNDEELCVYKCIEKNEKFAMVLAEHFAKIEQQQ
ncbi:deoxyadenosine kinase [Heterostelium album PN500]|uniref:Deoxyadenosine kinase n=1 Tax=Heterostelium pallidum (strain ATCC 26659 / Pp 5 / PN500) TaxID=670386 RepID=D3B9Y0_HETP5|nr:deoxyadenosine kinase [Heterostelium album PN500]EFA81367.1 deoxyadenosine kinase [Heterostelium album PN500]|eukprot:XP_020433485.1 deoxyadenosine kinase [Heterostelium album PN500]